MRILGSLVSGLLLGGLASIALVGCEAPTDIVPVAPPGAPNPRISPVAEPAQAKGEMAAPALQTESQPVKVVEYRPAPPTAKGHMETTARGVKYETLKEGSGRELKPGQAAQFHYVGTLENGRPFDSTRERNQPATFTIGAGVIEGWQEALPGMKVGEVRKLIIPPALGYAERGHPPDIPPNATLIFEVELVRLLGE
jgi:FKBP-type peptidyl-prolyl cis-trans isomerase